MKKTHRKGKYIGDIPHAELYVRDKPRHSGKSKYSYGVRFDLGHLCRSSWEANYARILLHEGIAYEYEPERFPIDVLGKIYIPDFKLGDGYYVEVKGQDTELARWKRIGFRKQYGHTLFVIGKKRYHKLKHEYQDIILNWEK